VVKKEREERHNQLQRTRREITTVEKAKNQFETQWQETLKKQGKQLSEADYKEYNTLRTQVVGRTSNNQSKLDNLVRQAKTDEVTVNSLKGKVDSVQAIVERLEGEVSVVEERRDATKESIKEISSDIDSKKKEFNHIQSERVRINQLHTEKEEKLQALLKQLVEADAGRRQNDKEQRTKETIVALKRLYPGVRGRVGDLCKPKQKKYDEAVITALGRDFDSVIVDTEKTGTECVQYLKDKRSSPMTFIPLDNIKVTGPDASLKGFSKARLTIDTIDFDSSLERAMAYACGSSVVCDDLQTAKHICYERKIQVKAVTLEGFVIHKAGLMTGGRGPEKQGSKRKFDDQDIENLRSKVDQFREDIAALPKVNRKSADEEALQSDLNALEQRLSYAKGELHAFEQNLASKKKELAHERGQLKEMKPKYEGKKSSLEKISDTVKKFQDAVSKVQDEVFADFCKRLGYSDIRAYEAQQGSLEQEAAEKRSAFEVQKRRLASNLDWETSQYEAVDKRVKEMEEHSAGLERDIEAYKDEKAVLEEAIDVDRAKATEHEDELHKLKEKLGAKTDKVNQARNELQKRSKEIDNRTKAIASLETEVQRTGAGRYALLRRCKLEQITIPLTAESRKLDSLPVNENVLQADPDAMDVDEGDEAPEVVKDYGIEVDFSELDEDLQKPDEEEVEEILLQKITDLNSELEKLNPNMRAIDRLDGVEARLKSTDKDFEDARRAAKKSKDAFTDVKEQRFDLFNKAFTHISEQIQHVYKDLTRSSAFPLGGSAYLDIEDSDAPYLSGIKYHAMPPLKRFRDMEHLSGGEKTWLRSLSSSPSTVTNPVLSSCSTKSMLRLITPMLKRSRTTLESMQVRECSLL
jgi:structural maintenance of chromosome 1